MLKQEEQKFDLLENLREAARTGITITKDAMSRCSEKDVSISGTFVSASELTELKKLLIKAEQAKSIEELRLLLNEDSIPVELVIIDQFWGRFQELIYNLEREEPER